MCGSAVVWVCGWWGWYVCSCACMYRALLDGHASSGDGGKGCSFACTAVWRFERSCLLVRETHLCAPTPCPLPPPHRFILQYTSCFRDQRGPRSMVFCFVLVHMQMRWRAASPREQLVVWGSPILLCTTVEVLSMYNNVQAVLLFVLVHEYSLRPPLSLLWRIGNRHVPEGEAVQRLRAAREGFGRDRPLPESL